MPVHTGLSFLSTTVTDIDPDPDRHALDADPDPANYAGLTDPDPQHCL
jgi:hypothetical protein